MIKEQALKIAKYRDAQVLVERIYDDFESRTCENCKYTNNGRKCGIYEEWKLIVKDKGEYEYRLKKFNTDFGCNKFERKINEVKT